MQAKSSIFYSLKIQVIFSLNIQYIKKENKILTKKQSLSIMPINSLNKFVLSTYAITLRTKLLL